MIDANARQLQKLVEHALADVEHLPISEQIDLHQAAAFVTATFAEEASALLAHTAHCLREAERHQLKFRQLLKG